MCGLASAIPELHGWCEGGDAMSITRIIRGITHIAQQIDRAVNEPSESEVKQPKQKVIMIAALLGIMVGALM
jgi:hypothetical protein